MRRLRRPGARAFCVLALAWTGAVPAFADRGPPDWLLDAAAADHPAFDREVPAVTLLRDRTVTVSEDGRIATTERGAIRVLTTEGRGYARCAAFYSSSGGKVTHMAAWLVPPTGSAQAFDKKDCVDEQIAPNDLYSESRRRYLSAADRASPGAVFGYEWTREARTVFAQFDWAFQDHRLPARVSRLTLRLPPGWTATGIILNHEPVAPVRDGDALRWELHDLSYVKEEPAAPPVTACVPHLAVGFRSAATDPGSVAAFETWPQVSQWLASLSDPQAEGDEALRTRAAALISGQSDELERIRAIGRYVQGLNYVAIQTGIERGGGYRPHTARLVLEKGYGDCKDKANLMRALLATVDIPSWLVTIYATDPSFVRETWPSPQQFDHCIIAIRAPAGPPLATVVEHDSLGPLILFDPTDPLTPLGDLPLSEQGGLALLVGADEGCLIRAPRTPPEGNVLRREIDARLGADGRLDASLHESSTGAPARTERGLRNGTNEAQYRRVVEGWVGRGVPGATIAHIVPVDDRDNGRFSLDLDFAADHYGRRVSDDLYAFCPVFLARRESFAFTAAERTLPIVLAPEREEEAVHVALPAAFTVEALPDSVTLESDFCSYRSSCAVTNGRLHFSRSLEIRQGTLPAERYAEVQGFFRALRKAETAMVLLRMRP